jgi:hypothetical protein
MNFLTIEAFQQNLLTQVNIIEEKEVQILSALSDLIPINLDDSDFIKNSLQFLDTNFNLTKGVWKILLKLYDKVPNFVDILSHWKLLKPDYLSEDCWLHINIPHSNLPFYFENRKHSIQKLFVFINSLLSHFSVDAICELAPLISEKFNYIESPFSRENIDNPNLIFNPNFRFNPFTYRNFMYQLNVLDYRLKNISDKFYYPFNRTPKNKDIYLDSLSIRLNKLGIKSSNIIETQFQIFKTYGKYTNHPYPSYQGFEEIKKCTYHEDDEYILTNLIECYENSFSRSQASYKFFIHLFKIIYQYKDNLEKGFSKIRDIDDYFSMSNDYFLKFKKFPNFKTKDLLMWSNDWHINGEHINPFNSFNGQKKQFKNFNINHSIRTYKFIQITNNHDLYLEGKNQKHCVFNYENQCLLNKTIIVSMRDNNNVIISTLRFQLKHKKSIFTKNTKYFITFEENRKIRNVNCSQQEQSIANEYFDYLKKKIHKSII